MVFDVSSKTSYNFMHFLVSAAVVVGTNPCMYSSKLSLSSVKVNHLLLSLLVESWRGLAILCSSRMQNSNATALLG